MDANEDCNQSDGVAEGSVEAGSRRPRHELGGSGLVPGGPWKSWEDVPLALKAPELAIVLRVSRSTAYEAMRDGTIPSFRVRGTLRCTRVVVWAVANGLDPWEYVAKNPFVDDGPIIAPAS